MLNYLKGTSRRLLLTGLLIAWAVLLFGGFVLGSGADVTQRMPVWTRMSSSLALVAIGWSWFAWGRRGQTGRFALLLALGMTCGLVGDAVLAGLLPGGQNVLAGIAAFGAGHVCYILAASHWSARSRLDGGTIRWLSLGAWWAIGLGAWYVVVFRGQDATVLHWAALPYALLLASTAGMATSLAVQDRAYVPFAAGAALFLVSDLILAAQLFNGAEFRFVGDVIWFTYGVGQMLIVMTAGAARRQVARDGPPRSMRAEPSGGPEVFE